MSPHVAIVTAARLGQAIRPRPRNSLDRPTVLRDQEWRDRDVAIVREALRRLVGEETASEFMERIEEAAEVANGGGRE